MEVVIKINEKISKFAGELLGGREDGFLNKFYL
jgi:hypothetical protein